MPWKKKHAGRRLTGKIKGIPGKKMEAKKRRERLGKGGKRRGGC